MGFECKRLFSSIIPSWFLRLGCFLMSCGGFLRPFVILFFLGKKRFEAATNLTQFPENQG